MNFKISKNDVVAFNENTKPEFPKYTTQIMNLANQNGQGTRPTVVGQLSELLPEYVANNTNTSIEGWENWYINLMPNAQGVAVERVMAQIAKLKEAINKIDQEMVEKWIRDLVITKTFTGLYVQGVIIKKLGENIGLPSRLATPEEEAKGIDGFVGDTPYSIKPESYKTMERLPEQINVKMIYYTKTDSGFNINVEE